MLLLQQMMALFLMMLIGYLCAKIGALDQTASKKISWLVINVGNPAMIIASGMDNENPVEIYRTTCYNQDQNRETIHKNEFEPLRRRRITGGKL